MAGEKRSFEDLLKEAPKAPSADTVSLVGTLAQSSEKGKFVLTISSGQSVTLETSAVKSHEVLGSSVGHTVVRVDIDRAHLPAGLAEGTTAVAADTARNAITNPAIDHIHTLATFDQFPTIYIYDVHPTVAWFDHPKYPWLDPQYPTLISDLGGNTLQETIPDPTGGVVNPAAGAMPFSIAAQHQASPMMLSAHGHLPKFTHDPWKVLSDSTPPWLREYRDY